MNRELIQTAIDYVHGADIFDISDKAKFTEQEERKVHIHEAIVDRALEIATDPDVTAIESLRAEQLYNRITSFFGNNNPYFQAVEARGGELAHLLEPLSPDFSQPPRQ